MTEKTCPDCGAVYEVTQIKVPMRDKDREECACGHILASWDGSNIPQFRLIKPGKAPHA
jgi:hypothetical protein